MPDEKKNSEKKDEAVEQSRYEDRPENLPPDPEGHKPVKLTAEEVDPNEARRDDTTLLAQDQVAQDGTITRG